MQEMEKTAERAMINDVCVFGANLLHPKMLEIIKYALVSEPDEDLQAIFMSTTGPRTNVGQYSHHTRSLVISLPQILEDAVNVMGTDDEVGLSISAHIWFGIIYSLFHELHHNVALAIELRGGNKNYLDLDDDWHEAEEELAREYAEEKVEEAIIRCKAEVPEDIMDIPWIGERAMDYLVKELKDDPDWVRTIKDRLDNGIVFENKDGAYDSLVEYFKANTEHPEKYETENKGAATEMVAELPNLFDKKILPGEQRELFPDNLGGSVSPPISEEETKAIAEMTAEVLNKGKEPMHDDVHDHLPPEATMAPEECGSVRGDPFAPEFDPPQATNEEGLFDWGCWGKFPAGVTPPGWDEAQERLDKMEKAKAAAQTAAAEQPAQTNDPFTVQYTPQVQEEVKTFPGGRNAEQFYTETGQDTADEKMVKVEVGYKKEDGSAGYKTLYPSAEAIATARHILVGMYMRLYQQMFTGDVLTPVMLTDAEKTLGLVIGCSIWDGTKSIYVDVSKTGTVAGLKYKNGTLPAYDLILNWGGRARRVKMIAQNPEKQSTYGARARAGEKIAWLIEVLPGGNGDFMAKIENGVYSLCERR